MPRTGALALVLLSLPGSAFAGWEYQTSHFRVISEPGPEVALAAGRHLEAVRQRFAELDLPVEDERPEPALVLIFASRVELDPYASADSRDRSLTRGLSVLADERGWMAVAWDAPGSPLTALAHEYAHLVRPGAASPLWFREGLAEYLAELGTGGGPRSTHHLEALREQPWTAWREFLAAGRMSAVFARRNFYAQAWLVVDWLAAQGTSALHLNAPEFESLLEARGAAWIDAQLHEHYERLLKAAAGSTEPNGNAPPEAAVAGDLSQVRPTDAWELPYWKAEFHRVVGHLDAATRALEALERAYPGIPEPSEGLGAIAIARGRYDEAEQNLRDAMRKGSRRAEAHYQYSLMLQRPVEGLEASGARRPEVEGRILEGVEHARLAREAGPGQPRFVLAEAQALVLAGHWSTATELLLALRAFPGWQQRAEEEFAELLRRRQQVLRSVAHPNWPGAGRPPGAIENADSGVAVALLNPGLAAVPPPREPDPEPWPPPGTVLLYGHIRGVECRRDSKIVTVKTPRYTVELVEPAARPAKLYHPPKKWAELPCGLTGYQVNVVFRPLPAGSEVRGELVAVVF